MAVWLSMDMSYVGAGDYDNTSKIAVNVYVHWDTVSYNGLSPALNVTVDGVNDTTNVSFNTGKTSSGSQNIYSRYWNIGHDSNGSAKTVYGSASYATGTASGTVVASSSLALAAIDSGSGDSGGDSGDDSEEDDNTGGGSGSGSSDKTTGNVTIVGQRTLNEGDDYQSDISYYTSTSGSIYNAFGANNKHLVIIKFITPKFIGNSASIDIELPCYYSYGGYGGDSTLNVALCESDDNYHLYFETTISDSYQIATTTVEALSYSSSYSNEVLNFSIQTSCLKSEHEYYLIIWDEDWGESTTFSINPVDDNLHNININYIDSVVYIEESSGFAAYQCYIDNGSIFELYIPYIDNGTSWEAIY